MGDWVKSVGGHLGLFGPEVLFFLVFALVGLGGLLAIWIAGHSCLCAVGVFSERVPQGTKVATQMCRDTLLSQPNEDVPRMASWVSHLFGHFGVFAILELLCLCDAVPNAGGCPEGDAGRDGRAWTLRMEHDKNGLSYKAWFYSESATQGLGSLMGAGLDCIAGAVQQVSNIKCALRSGLTHNVGAQTQSELPQHVHQVGCGLVSQGALCLWVGYLVCPLSQVLVSHVGLPFWLLAFWIAGHALQMLGLVITLGTLQRPFRGQLLSGLAEWEGAPVHKCHADAHTKGFSFFGHFGHLSVLDSNCLHLGQQRPSHEKGNAKLDARPTAKPAPPRDLPGHRWSALQRRDSFSWLFWFCILGGLFRFGEAAHPGPAPVSDTWTFGLANASGLTTKVDQVAHQEGQAWVFSETHLSKQGYRSFKKGLQCLKTKWKYLIPGAPCPVRKTGQAGVHSGVLLVSSYPARALPHSFDSESFATGRMQVAGMMVGSDWVTVGMLYGVPCNATHHFARYQTETMLADLIDRVACQASGPRMIGGDFNYATHELSQVQRLQEYGFREVQDLWAWKTGVSVSPTGRGTKRIDQLWISPELQVVLEEV